MHQHLTTHGTLIALSDQVAGNTTVTLISPVDDIDRVFWCAALAEHGVLDGYLDWDYYEAGGMYVWNIEPLPVTFATTNSVPTIA